MDRQKGMQVSNAKDVAVDSVYWHRLDEGGWSLSSKFPPSQPQQLRWMSCQSTCIPSKCARPNVFVAPDAWRLFAYMCRVQEVLQVFQWGWFASLDTQVLIHVSMRKTWWCYFCFADSFTKHQKRLTVNILFNLCFGGNLWPKHLLTVSNSFISSLITYHYNQLIYIKVINYSKLLFWKHDEPYIPYSRHPWGKHKHPDTGEKLPCDRRVVYKQLRDWYGKVAWFIFVAVFLMISGILCKPKGNLFDMFFQSVIVLLVKTRPNCPGRCKQITVSG